MKTKAGKDRLTPEQFVLLALERLKKDNRPGIHSVYSGFNEAFRAYFPGMDPVATVKELAEQGKIKTRLTKGGAVIYPPDAEVPSPTDASQALKKMGLA